MKQRCYNSKHKAYKNYGDRGVTICDIWLTSTDSFIDWALANGYSSELTIDREDNDFEFDETVKKSGLNEVVDIY